MSAPTEDQLVLAVQTKFRTFGGGQTSEWNPLVAALQDKQPIFAAGVDVREVVRFVIQALALDIPEEWTVLMSGGRR